MNHLFYKIKKLYQKYRQIIYYLFFGACTMLINTAFYWLLYNKIKISNTASTLIAWIVAVIFAFATNKLIVFKSKAGDRKQNIKEITSFFSCRLVTGILDIVIMMIAVDVLHWNSLVWKLISNIIVTVINYSVSKFYIFKKNKNGPLCLKVHCPRLYGQHKKPP